MSIIDDILKSKVYVKNPSEVPKGFVVHRGKRGGLYYETTPTKPSESKLPESKPSEAEKIKIEEAPSELINLFEKNEGKIVQPNNPVNKERFVGIIEKSANKLKKILGNSKVYLFAASYNARAFTVPQFENSIFIPHYDKEDFKSVEEDYAIKVMANDNKRIYYKYVNESQKKHFDDWYNKIDNLTLDDAMDKSLLHEKGHLETFKFMKEKTGSNNYLTDPEKLEKIFIKYLNYYQVTNHFIMSVPLSVKQQAYTLGEMIAEDYRLIKGKELNQSLFPSRFFYKEDIFYKDRMEERHRILKEITGW